MKNLLILTVVLLWSITAIGQGQIFKAQEVSVQMLQNNKKWSPWSDWKTSDVLVAIDMNKSLVTIHGKKKEALSVISTSTPHKENGKLIFEINCLNEQGKECLFKMVDGEGDNFVFYFYYDEYIISYKVLRID